MMTLIYGVIILGLEWCSFVFLECGCKWSQRWNETKEQYKFKAIFCES